MKTPNEWLAESRSPDWAHAAATMANKWDRNPGKLISNKEYLDAIEDASTIGVK